MAAVFLGLAIGTIAVSFVIRRSSCDYQNNSIKYQQVSTLVQITNQQLLNNCNNSIRTYCTSTFTVSDCCIAVCKW